MKILNQSNFSNNSFIDLKDDNWLTKQRIAGKIAASALVMLENQVKDKTKLSMIELNNMAEELIIKSGATPTFKGYKGFPAGTCISINQTLVHGIPTDYKLQEGDVVSFDLGATYEGAIADTALTCIYGEARSERHIELVRATKEALAKGIEAVAVGKQLGCIGDAVYNSGRSNGFSVISKYGGHGIGLYNCPHAAPFVSNKAKSNEGIRIQKGLVIAIEPLLCIGSPETQVMSDSWTVKTSDINSHEEHSLYVHENYVEILTDRHI